ncbi:MAG: FAD-binding protein [Parvularculaceae bacterium]
MKGGGRHADAGSFIARARVVGAENLLTDEASPSSTLSISAKFRSQRRSPSSDPRTTPEVSQIVRAAGEAECGPHRARRRHVYTLGYAPRDEDTAILDMKRMNSIRINAEDLRLIEIEPGATWAEVHAALQPTGLRIGCMGTMSGIAATIGGGLQETTRSATGAATSPTTSWVSKSYSATDASCSRARLRRTPEHPVLRSYGPDLAGLFTHDAGVFGVKTKPSSA